VLPHGILHDDTNVKVKVGHEPFHQQALRAVLLAEVGERGLHNVEEFRHDGRDAAEMAGAAPAQNISGQSIHTHTKHTH